MKLTSTYRYPLSSSQSASSARRHAAQYVKLMREIPDIIVMESVSRFCSASVVSAARHLPPVWLVSASVGTYVQSIDAIVRIQAIGHPYQAIGEELAENQLPTMSTSNA